MGETGNGNDNVVPMQPRHVSATMAQAFLEGSLSPDERLFVIRHLLQNCEKCTKVFGEVASGAGILGKISTVLFTELAVEPEPIGTRRLTGVAQWAELQTVEGPIQWLNSREEFHTMGLYERAIEVALLEVRRDPPKALVAAQIAQEVASNLPIPEPLRNDYLAAATAIYATATRMGADFAGAETALNLATDYASEGTADPLVAAAVSRHLGAYLADVGRYKEAEEAYTQALLQYELVADEHMQGRVLLSLTCIAGEYNPEKALLYLHRAADLFDPSVEPMLEWLHRHHEIWLLNELGGAQGALTLLEKSRDLYMHFARTDVWVRLRMYWLEGRIAFNLGRHAEAVKILRMLFRMLDQEGKHPVELTLIGVDLLHAMSEHRGLDREIIAFSETLLSVTRNLGLHTQGRAIILLLKNRLVQGVMEAERWRLVKQYFRFHWRAELPEPPRIVPT